MWVVCIAGVVDVPFDDGVDGSGEDDSAQAASCRCNALCNGAALEEPRREDDEAGACCGGEAEGHHEALEHDELDDGLGDGGKPVGEEDECGAGGHDILEVEASAEGVGDGAGHEGGAQAEAADHDVLLDGGAGEEVRCGVVVEVDAEGGVGAPAEGVDEEHAEGGGPGPEALVRGFVLHVEDVVLARVLDDGATLCLGVVVVVVVDVRLGVFHVAERLHLLPLPLRRSSSADPDQLSRVVRRAGLHLCLGKPVVLLDVRQKG